MSRFTAGFQAFIDELKRRNVFRVAAGYVVGGFFVLEAANLVFQGLGTPPWLYRALTILLLVGFPVVLILSWLFHWTPQGIRREPEAETKEARPAGPSAILAPQRPSTVRAFAFVGLGIVVAVVVMGLSLPYVAAQRSSSTREAQREGVVPVGLQGEVATLAVLPFVSLTGVDDAGFADGLAEDITAALAQLGSVNVVSRTTSEAYRNSDKTARAIGAELGVGLILEGTIRRAGSAVRVTVQLIDAARDRHLWANTYDREIDGDVFDVQSNLAQEIVAAIQSVVTPTEAEGAERRLLASRVADEGTELLSRANPAYDEAAEQLFEQALAADSSNPRALAGMAQTMATRVHVGGPPALLDSAQRHALHAIELDPEAPDGYAAHAFVLLVQGKVDSAIVALRRANELDETGVAFEFEWADRIEMIAPEMLEMTREAIENGTFQTDDDGSER